MRASSSNQSEMMKSDCINSAIERPLLATSRYGRCWPSCVITRPRRCGPAARNFLQQQARFDDFVACYNQERPHQALDMKYPAELYRPSAPPYHGLDELHYPFHDRTITVTPVASAWVAAARST